MIESNLQPTPMITSLKLPKDATVVVQDPALFQFVVGALQYVILTRLS